MNLESPSPDCPYQMLGSESASPKSTEDNYWRDKALFLTGILETLQKVHDAKLSFWKEVCTDFGIQPDAGSLRAWLIRNKPNSPDPYPLNLLDNEEFQLYLWQERESYPQVTGILFGDDMPRYREKLRPAEPAHDELLLAAATWENERNAIHGEVKR